MIAVEVGDLEKTTLVSVYRPPDSLASSLETFLDILDDFLTKLSTNTTVIMGDFNLDLMSQTPPVEKYTNTVLSNGFHFCGKTPTRYEACLDHVITNNTDLLIAIHHLQYSLFDHDALFIEIEREIHRTPPERGSFPKTNIGVLREYLQQNPMNTSTLHAVDVNYNTFASQIQAGMRASTRNVRPKKKSKEYSKPWVDDEMKDCFRTKNYWYWKHGLNSEDADTHKVYKYWSNTVTTLKRTKMKTYFANRFESQQSSITGTWNVIKEALGKQKQKRVTLTDNYADIQAKHTAINDANEYFADVGANLANRIPYAALPPLRTQTQNQFMLHPVTHTAVSRTIAKMPASKSSGYDGILPNIFKQCSDILVDSITDIVNSSIRQSRVPSELKISRVVTIPKTAVPTNFSDYRPINIPSVTDKVLQKVVNKQLVDHLQRHDLLSRRQYGFRPQSNTQTALFDVVAEIQKHCDKKDKVAAVFLDLSKAFDTCDKRILLRRLRELGVNGSSLQWFDSFLDERQQYVSVDNLESELRTVNYGVVQGSIIGPTLFNCYINSLKDLSLRGTLFMYADDIVIVYAKASQDELQSCMNEDLEQLLKWMNQHKLTVNTSKTKYMMFNTPRDSNMDIKYDGETIEMVHTFKYLGVWLDDSLKWTDHVAKLTTKLAQIAGIFKRISPLLPIETKRNLYFSLFYSHLIYGIAVWGAANSSVIRPLQTIQNKAIKNLFGYHRRTSTALIHANHRIHSVNSAYTIVACSHIHQMLSNCIHSNTELNRGEDRHQHNTRRRRNLTTGQINTRTFGQNSALYKAIVMYNSLEEDLKSLNQDRFKAQLKNHLYNDQF